VGLALAGGGPLGGIYEMGALLALSESLDGIDLNDVEVYGVSSGAFIAAGLATASPRRRCTVFSSTTKAMQHFRPPCSSALHCANSRVAH